MPKIKTPHECLQIPLPRMGDSKSNTAKRNAARAALLRARLRKLRQGRLVAKKLLEDYDAYINKNNERLAETLKSIDNENN